MRFGRLLLLYLLFACAYYGWKHFHTNNATTSSTAVSTEQMASLANTVKAQEVVMYSTSECTYCAQAKSWLQQNGFAYTECNMSTSKQCENEYNAYHADGTPFLVIRRAGKPEYLMRNGFDSDEFITALKT